MNTAAKVAYRVCLVVVVLCGYLLAYRQGYVNGEIAGRMREIARLQQMIDRGGVGVSVYPVGEEIIETKVSF